MSTTTIFILIIGIAAVIAVVGIIAVARGRSDSDGAETEAELDRKAVKADKARRKALAAATASTASTSAPSVTMVEPAEEYTEDAPRVEVSATELGVTRRKFFNRALTAVFGLFMLQFALAGLAFFWPKLKGGFGTPIKVGEVGALKSEVLVAGAIVPKFVPAAQAWIVPFEMSSLEGSSFEETPFVVAGGESDGIGLMALWQRCVHLGCRVPSCESSRGFECPCHGSKYNGHGEYAAGPAPRNLDRFAVSVDSGGILVVDTGTVVRTARAKTYTVDYPQGPFCVG